MHPATPQASDARHASAPMTQVEIAERAGNRDLPDIGLGPGRRRQSRLKRGDSPVYLALLMLDPRRNAMLFRAKAAFIDDQDRRFADAIGQRLRP